MLNNKAWVSRSRFINRMVEEHGLVPEKFFKKLRIKPIQTKDEVGKHRYFNHKQWIYVNSKRHVVIHEILHALRNETKTRFPMTTGDVEYQHDPEEFEAVIWEMRYLRSCKTSKREIFKTIQHDSEWPIEFIEELWEGYV